MEKEAAQETLAPPTTRKTGNPWAIPRARPNPVERLRRLGTGEGEEEEEEEEDHSTVTSTIAANRPGSISHEYHEFNETRVPSAHPEDKPTTLAPPAKDLPVDESTSDCECDILAVRAVKLKAEDGVLPP